MRLPSTFLSRRTPVDLQLTPMIDCVFLLMVYFIWSSSFQIAEQQLPTGISAEQAAGSGSSDLPPPPEADFEQVVVRIRRQGQKLIWVVNEVPQASLGQLKTVLVPIARIKRDVPLVIHPDPNVTLGDTIEAFDLARKIGFEQVRLAANKTK